jgi:hypothetical protein
LEWVEERLPSAREYTIPIIRYEQRIDGIDHLFVMTSLADNPRCHPSVAEELEILRESRLHMK